MAGVRYDPRRRCFVTRSRPVRRYRGLTALLTRLQLSSRPRCKAPAGVKAYGRRSARGIDRQITRAIERGTCDSLRSGEAKAFFDALRRWSLRPISAQVPVCAPALRLATALDVVALDARGRCVVLEVKCGYEGTFERGPAAPISRGPLKGMSSSPLLYAWVQAAVGARMYGTNAGVRVRRVGVVQVCRAFVKLLPVPAEVSSRTTEIMAALRGVCTRGGRPPRTAARRRGGSSLPGR